MKTVNVVAAVICDDLNRKSKVFATQRGYGEYKDGWEFPGGKIEPGETPEAALRREIEEELATTVAVGALLGNIEYDYTDFHLSMAVYQCRVLAGRLTLLEHESARWLSREQLGSVDWLPADRLILGRVAQLLP